MAKLRIKYFGPIAEGFIGFSKLTLFIGARELEKLPSQNYSLYAVGLKRPFFRGDYDVASLETLDFYEICRNQLLEDYFTEKTEKEILPLFVVSVIFAFTLGGGDHTTSHNFMVIFSCVIVIKLSAVIVRKEKLYSLCSYLAGFSFFLFAIHAPLVNGYTSKLWIWFFPMRSTFWSLCQYFIPTFLTIVIGTGIGIVIKKICPPLFRALNGGR